MILGYISQVSEEIMLKLKLLTTTLCFFCLFARSQERVSPETRVRPKLSPIEEASRAREFGMAWMVLHESSGDFMDRVNAARIVLALGPMSRMNAYIGARAPLDARQA